MTNGFNKEDAIKLILSISACQLAGSHGLDLPQHVSIRTNSISPLSRMRYRSAPGDYTTVV